MSATSAARSAIVTLFRTVFIVVSHVALVGGLTFGFVVLFEYGPENFVENAETEWTAIEALIRPADPDASQPTEGESAPPPGGESPAKPSE